MKYVEVLPLTNTGSETAFTYESESEVAVGSIVTIPLRNRNVRGMVTKAVSKPKFATKKITKVLSAEPVLTETQLELAHKISDYYFCSLGDTIGGMLPFEFGKKRRIQYEEADAKELEKPLAFTKEQEQCFKSIKNAKPGSKHLLFGVTGSGKTEIYLQLAAEGLKKGQGSIILVPEISLTPQTLSRFEKRFGNKVAVWHSGLKETEKYANWEKIKSGEKMIVLGARSAIFTPIKNLGYIFIDEEHESSYKQDQVPRYETTRVAEWMADLTGAKLVLGSATPSVESYYKTENKDYNLCLLNNRIVQDSMPPVELIDLREEFKKGNKSIFSDRLLEEIKATLAAKKQVMLFVNRRGASTFVVCRDCGYVEECPHCEIPLTFHLSDGKIGHLHCHHCGFRKSVPTACPECSSYAIRYFGLGTQRVEIEAKKLFPKAKVARMDRDTTTKRGSHEEIYRDFAAGDSDILIGTQLIAKGWDLPNVTLVGVISADTMLNLPDFKSGERTFDLLTQISGRVGRGFHPGKVVVQTYNPENYAIVAAAKHDFKSFYEKEIVERKKYSYPPFSKLVKMVFAGPLSETVELEAKRVAGLLDNKEVEVIGPSPAFLSKYAGKYRWQIVMKMPKSNYKMQNKVLELMKPELKKGWVVDVNPDNLL
jgi:primosomal protein N' (replication factor Y)